MGSRSTPVTVALVSLSLVAVLSVMAWSLEPENAQRWAFRMFMLPALWGFLELAQYRGEDRGASEAAIMTWHRLVIAGIGLMTILDLSFHLAISTDLISADWAPIGQSLQGVLFGVGLTVWVQLLPTVPTPWSHEEQPLAWQKVHRFVGWVATSCGIAMAGVWMFLSVNDARAVSGWILGTFVVLGIGRKLVSVAAHAGARPTTMPSA